VVQHGDNVPVLAIKAYGGVEVQVRSFVTSALEGGEWLASCSNCFTAGESAAVTVCNRRLGRKHRRCGKLYRRRKFLVPTGKQTAVAHLFCLYVVTAPTPLSQLCKKDICTINISV